MYVDETSIGETAQTQQCCNVVDHTISYAHHIYWVPVQDYWWPRGGIRQHTHRKCSLMRCGGTFNRVLWALENNPLIDLCLFLYTEYFFYSSTTTSL